MPATATPAPAASPTPADADIDQRLNDMTLEEKAGQVMMVGFDGTTFQPALRDAIRDLRLGGIIIFERNVESPRALAQMISDAQAAAQAAGSPALLVGIDQEGGTVARLRESRGFTEFPSMMAVGATGEPANAARVAALVAGELTALGVNVNFAPVLDVNNNPLNPVIAQRSFGSDPQRVAEFGAAYIAALQSRGVLAVAKHFPGHGDTDTDSHSALPAVPHDRARLDAVELAPFRAAIAARVAGIMSAHVTFPAIDATQGLPGTLSPKVMTGLLRGELGYDGLSFTDSLEMGALATSGYPVPLAAATALKAGADILLFNRGIDDHRKAHALIVDWVKRGDLPVSRLNEAVRRVLRAKAGLPLRAPSGETGSAENKAVARDIAGWSITVVRDAQRLLPLAAGAPLLVIESPEAAGLGAAMGADMVLAMPARPTPAAVRSLASQAARSGRIVLLATADVGRNPQQADLANALLDAGVPLVVAAVRSPYDLMHIPRARTYVATYGASPLMFWALQDVLLGKSPARGALPVDIPLP